jgi:hypothetical protein
MGWLVALPCLAVLFVLNKKGGGFRKPQLRTAVQILKMLAAAGAGCGFVITFVGAWTAGGISSFEGLFNDWHVALGISVALVIVAGGIALLDIAADRVADRPAQYMAMLLPTLLALVVGGSLGKTGGDAVHEARNRLSSVVMTIGGGGAAHGKGHR